MRDGQAVQERAESTIRDGHGGWLSRLVSMLQCALDELKGLRRTLRRQRHGQEAQMEQVGAELQALNEAVSRMPQQLEEHLASQVAKTEAPGLGKAQVEALTRLDESLFHLLRQTQALDHQAGSGSTEEALVMLQIRARNLQRSFGMRAIEGLGELFDDRQHRAHSICHDQRLEDGVVAEVLLPGYRMDDRIIRPALVIVNRRA